MCSNYKNMIVEVLENLGYGVIYVDEDGRVKEYGDEAKSKLGLIVPEGKSHESGKLAKGDIVILADNILGNDDGIEPEDLKLLNICDYDIRLGDTILAMGTFGDPKSEPVYKRYGDYYPGNILSLREKYKGYDIDVTIDLQNSNMTIGVDGESFSMSYIESIGFMVIIDGDSGRVKFFQGIGYGYRGEEAGAILRGKSFEAKNYMEKQAKEPELTGLPLEKTAFGDDFINKVRSIIAAGDKAVYEGIVEIFHRQVFCNMIRIKKGGNEDGVIILIQDKDKIDKNLKVSQKFIDEIERKNKIVNLKLDTYRKEHFETFLGSSPEMRNVKHLAYKASKTKFNVIIFGENGTGKSRLAREIHNIQNADSPFVEVVCNSIAPSLFEAELFGYAPGAFTGADKNGRAGYFEEANGGTIFLDDIGELPQEIQVKLLHVLQNKQIYRVGSTKPININVRVITATNKDLEEEVKKGNWRQDLFYRINVFPITIPPLRDRRHDLTNMAETILKEFCLRYDMEEKVFSQEAIKLINMYDWPGNVRELENIIERAIVLCEGKTIYAEHLMINKDLLLNRSFKEQVQKSEERIIVSSLIANDYNKQKTMESLGLSRSVFYKKLKDYNLI